MRGSAPMFRALCVVVVLLAMAVRSWAAAPFAPTIIEPVTPGQIVTILGANGAGKTTVLKSVCGAMEPQKGSVAFAGRTITGREPDWVARHGIAHVPEGREIFPFMTVKGNLLMGAYARRDKDGIERDIEVVYSYFPVLRERAASAAGYLSGGQQQMLAIGRGLMARPKLMLLDEPSLGLSPLLTKEIFAIIISFFNADCSAIFNDWFI